MCKSKEKNRVKQITEEESIEYIKNIYDDLMKTYQALFEHMHKVEQLMREQKNKEQE